jgi:hypothetical protein
LGPEIDPHSLGCEPLLLEFETQAAPQHGGPGGDGDGPVGLIRAPIDTGAIQAAASGWSGPGRRTQWCLRSLATLRQLSGVTEKLQESRGRR